MGILKLPRMRIAGVMSLVVLFLITPFLMTQSNQAPAIDFTKLDFTSPGRALSWWNDDSLHAFAFSWPLVLDVSKSCNCISTTSLSTLQSRTLMISGSGSVTGDYSVQTDYQITFDSTGLSPDIIGSIITIDGIPYSYANIPSSFWWETGSSHTYSFNLLIGDDSGKRYALDDVTGLSTLSSDTIIVSGSGSIVGHYKTQYYLTLVTNPSDVNSPSGEGWYDSGTLAPISTTAFVDIISGSSRYRFNGWSTPDMVEIANASASPTTVLMDKAKTVTANYTIQYFVTFSQSGVGTDASAGINETTTLSRDVLLTVDAVNYTVWTVPVSFWWDQGSSHAFTFQSPMVVKLDSQRGKQYAWSSTSGLSSQRAESFTLTTYGTITGNYNTQYKLAVSSAHGDPTPSGQFNWFDSGASVTASVASPASGPTGTQYVCTGWTGTGSVPASGTGSSVTFTITSSSVIVWVWKTQYYLTVRTAPWGVATIPGDGWYDTSASVPLSAPSVSGYDFTYWGVDGNIPVQGVNITSITVTINAPGTATAHYSSPSTAPVGGRSIVFFKSTPTSMFSIYVVLIAFSSAVLASTRRRRQKFYAQTPKP